MFENIVIVAGHPRSGTHLVIDTIRLNFKKIRFPLLLDLHFLQLKILFCLMMVKFWIYGLIG